MVAVENYAAVQQVVFIDGHSRREAARVFGLNCETIAKMCRFSLPLGARPSNEFTRWDEVGSVGRRGRRLWAQ
ncbi:hypothetical protein FV226_24290 [Methylobacterium sp. WL12]|nr:hypothetical protein FV226_24290 [Methylobacterium sp. WL12]